MSETIESIAEIIDGAVVVLLILGTLMAFSRALASTLASRGITDRVLRQLRIDLGQSLLLSLEVLIVSDILHSIGKRTLEELSMLAIIVAIRIALAFFLDRELEGLRAQG